MAAMKKRSMGKYAVIGAALVLLNFVGISYAHWNDSLEINGSIITGHTNMVFDEYQFVDIAGTGGITVSFQRDDNNNQTIMNIQGRVEPGYQGKLHYSVENNGSIPVVFDGQRLLFNDGIILQLNQSNGKLKQQQTGNSKLDIHVPPGLSDGTYSFEMELYYKQWNG